MKKLMIAAAIVCAAAYANAENYFYTFENIPAAQGGGSLYTGPMTITCDAAGFSEEVYADDGFFDFSSDAGTFREFTEYTILLTADTGTHTYLETQSVTGSSFGFSCHFYGTGTWTAVPEPTSGLLMLLGMAGLCLRRKQRS